MNKRNVVRFVLFKFLKFEWNNGRTRARFHHWIVFERHMKNISNHAIEHLGIDWALSENCSYSNSRSSSCVYCLLMVVLPRFAFVCVRARQTSIEFSHCVANTHLWHELFSQPLQVLLLLYRRRRLRSSFTHSHSLCCFKIHKAHGTGLVCRSYNVYTFTYVCTYIRVFLSIHFLFDGNERASYFSLSLPLRRSPGRDLFVSIPTHLQ